MKIVILDGYTENPGDLSWEGFEKLGELTVYDRTDINNHDEIVTRIGDAEMVIINKVPLQRKTLEACQCLKYIGVLATGYNIVDCEAASELGIAVTNIPSYGTEAVGQFAIALLLEICHHIGHHSQAVKEGKWSQSIDWCFWDFPLIELAGKTMGILGYGRIGRTTGRLAEALGMTVRVYDKYQDKTHETEKCKYVSQDEVFAQSDVLVLHCPLSSETKDIINRGNIAKMKEGVIIINNSRGGLIVEADLAEALNNGKVYAAGLDVVSIEPIRPGNPLLTARNCIITPHISWASKESRQRLMDIAINNAKMFLDGTPANLVNGI